MSVPREGLEVVERPVLSPPTAGLRPRSLAAAVDFTVVVMFSRMVLESAELIVSVFRPVDRWDRFMWVGAFIFGWPYFLLAEVLFDGRSFGKVAVGLRVIRDEGEPFTVVLASGQVSSSSQPSSLLGVSGSWSPWCTAGISRR
jgi:uncharacterized RDD family membrane protein YckC